MLYVKPEAAVFKNASTLDSVVRVLDSLEDSTVSSPITDPNDLCLHKDGTTIAGNYRLLSSAFKSLTSMIAPKARGFLADLSGDALIGKPPHLSDPHLAVDLWNKLIRLRFSKIENLQLVRNVDKKTIDGVISENYKFISNADLFQLATSVLSTEDPEAEFYSAKLVGRQFISWFRCPQPVLSISYGNIPVSYYTGYMFGNHETIGMSVRMRACVFSRFGFVSTIGGKGSNLSHRGADFRERLASRITSLVDKENYSNKLTTAISRLTATSLGVERGQLLDVATPIVAKLTTLLRGCNISLAAASAVAHAAVFGNYLPAQQENFGTTMLRSPAGIDILHAMMHVGRSIDYKRRTYLDRCASALLSDNTFLDTVI